VSPVCEFSGRVHTLDLTCVAEMSRLWTIKVLMMMVARRIETSKRARLWQRVRDSTENLSESKVTLGAVEVLGSLTMARSWLKACDI
jgi:hypothetical protein